MIEVIDGQEYEVTTTPGGTVIRTIAAAPPEPEAQPDPCEWLLDTGAFFDRFGAAKLDVLTSADATVKALLQDVSVRKWIDLTRPDVAQGLALIGAAVPSVTAELQTAILTTPVAASENSALRKLYF